MSLHNSWCQAYTFKLLWSIGPLLAAPDSHLLLRSAAHPEQGNWSVTEFRQSSPLIPSRIYHQFWFSWRRVFTSRMFSQNRKKTSPLPQSCLMLKKNVWKVTKVQDYREWVKIDAILCTLIPNFLSTERQQNKLYALSQQEDVQHSWGCSNKNLTQLRKAITNALRSHDPVSSPGKQNSWLCGRS